MVPVVTSLPELTSRLRSGQLPIAGYLDDLRSRFDQLEPDLQAFVPEAGRFDRLRREAAALLGRYPDPAGRPPLFGVPVGVKDIFHAEGFVTRAGSRLPPELLQGPEADSVSRLKRAGALIFGKTVTTEFAYFGPGPTRNPHHPEHTPGGSSSGSAAAVAAGLCPLAVGTQTIGSTVRPAAYCGIVGFKPTYDRIPRAGVIPLSPSVDHVGLFAADLAGVSLAARVVIGDWSLEIDGERPVLGIPEGPFLAQASREAGEHFRMACRALTDAGYQVEPAPAMSDIEAVQERHNRIVAAEAAQVHADWFAGHSVLYHAKTAELIVRGQGVPPEALAAALEGRAQLRGELADRMDRHRIDLWISPAATGPAPRGLESTGDPAMNLPWTHAGLPTVNVPAGRSLDGLPLSIQLAGRWRADERLLNWAQGIECALADSGGQRLSSGYERTGV